MPTENAKCEGGIFVLGDFVTDTSLARLEWALQQNAARNSEWDQILMAEKKQTTKVATKKATSKKASASTAKRSASSTTKRKASTARSASAARSSSAKAKSSTKTAAAAKTKKAAAPAKTKAKAAPKTAAKAATKAASAKAAPKTAAKAKATASKKVSVKEAMKAAQAKINAAQKAKAKTAAKKAAPKAAAKPAAPAKPAAVKAAQPAAKPAVAATDKKKKSPAGQRHGFKINEHVVYPSHGVGKIIGIEEQEIAGMSLELFVINFDKEKLTLRVPTGKLESVGMRKLADEALVTKGLAVLKGRARIKRTMWSRRAQEYIAKINSGDLISIAEVVRDLYRSEAQPEQSYSERQLYEEALDRMAREVAAVEKLDERGAVQRITDVLSKSARGRRAAEEEAEAADAGKTEEASAA